MSERNAGIGFGADSIVSTAPDVARFLGGLLGGELLSPRMLAEMTTTVPADGVEAVAYGLGIAEMTSALGLSPSPCGPAWGHLGLRPGHTTIAFSRLDGSSQAVVIVNAGLFGSDVWTALGATAWHAYCGQAGDP